MVPLSTRLSSKPGGKGQFPVKSQLDTRYNVRSLVCMRSLAKPSQAVSRSPSLSLSSLLWSLWCVTVVNRVSESRSRVDSVVCFRLVAGCRRESIPALRVPPLFLFPCSSIPLALAPSAALCVAVSLSPSLPLPIRLIPFLPSSTCSPLLLSLDGLSRRSYPLSFFHCSLPTLFPEYVFLWPVLLYISYLGRVITCPFHPPSLSIRAFF